MSRARQDQVGLEVVPANMPIEMLVQKGEIASRGAARWRRAAFTPLQLTPTNPQKRQRLYSFMG
ncbi:MAG: hypothetical protein ACTHKU_12330 [Verrucomicrobiota bacterium]